MGRTELGTGSEVVQHWISFPAAAAKRLPLFEKTD